MGQKLWRDHTGEDSDVGQKQWRQHSHVGWNVGSNKLEKTLM